MINVSQSKIKSFRQCRQQYSLKYVEGLKKKKVRRAFQFGRIVHEMLEADANGDDPFEKLNQIAKENMNVFRVQKEEYGEIVEDIRYIMTEYFDHWSSDDIKPVRVKGRSAEHEFSIEIIPGVFFKGKIDLILRAMKLRWVGEHKTFKRMPSEDHRWKSIQSGVYIRAIDMLGYKPVDGTWWDYIRSSPPPRPELLKSGAMSQRKISTLPSVVKDFIKENKLPFKEYAEFIKSTEENRSSYFFRVFTPLGRSTVDLIYEDFVASAREIVDFHENDRKPIRNIGQHCDFCDYEPICRAMLQGLDVDFVKEREYVKDDKEVEEPIVSDEG